MANEDEASKPGQQQPEGERKFSQQQYDMLKRCSDKKDITEWNDWRKENPFEEIHLQGAHLEDAWLWGVNLENANLEGAYLEHAYLREAHLEKANLSYAYLEHALLMDTHLEYSKLVKTHLENAILFNAYLEEAYLLGAHLEKANLVYAHLDNANFLETHLENAHPWETNLRGARFRNAKLQGANFSCAIVDGKTLFSENCEVDRDTKFESVALGNLRIYPSMRQLLEYNTRRINWELWYIEHPKLKWLVKPFWLMSDYGLSTGRIIVTFFGLALTFANIYYHCGRIAPPGIVDTLFVDRNGIEVESWLVPLRTLYFSIVTMTTLGFGDMYANAHSLLGHILLSLQVLLGYVLLGAMVTRFAVLFTAGGPAGKFSPTKTKETTEGEENKA